MEREVRRVRSEQIHQTINSPSAEYTGHYSPFSTVGKGSMNKRAHPFLEDELFILLMDKVIFINIKFQ